MSDSSFKKATSEELLINYCNGKIEKKTVDNLHFTKINDFDCNKLGDYKFCTTAITYEGTKKLALHLNESAPRSTFLVCENDTHCYDILNSFKNIDAIPTIVDRIITGNSYNQVRTEPFYFWGAEKKYQLPEFITPVESFADAYRIKFFLVNTLHAICAWMGATKGFEFIHQSVLDPQISQTLKNIGTELCAILDNSTSSIDSTSILKQNLTRFANTKLMDSVFRVGRNPAKKLCLDERIGQPISLAKQMNLPFESIELGAAYAVDFAAIEARRNVRKSYNRLVSYLEG
ncbi:hypothetical protein [Desulfobaculum bizertense]|nr:hypothetical protein [Desulfobaculum bizertense]